MKNRIINSEQDARAVIELKNCFSAGGWPYVDLYYSYAHLSDKSISKESATDRFRASVSNSIGDVGGSPPLAHGGGIGSETGMLTAVGSFAAVSSRASLIPLFFHTIGTTHCSALIPSSITYNLAQIHNMLGHGTAKLALSLRAAKTAGYTSTTLGSQAEEASAKIGASRELAIGSPLERTLNLPPYNVRGAGVGRSCQRARRLTPCASKFPQRMRTGAHDLAPSSSLSLSLSFSLSLEREQNARGTTAHHTGCIAPLRL